MIRTEQLTKRYGDKVAVDHLSIQVSPGTVTGFLGPNGAGKSTTMRLIMGLDHPTSGTATVNGQAYARHRAPLREVGALLDAKALHPARSARAHLRAIAATQRIGNKRVDEVLEMTGLSSVANRRVGGFSLGMQQRLGIAVALLGDPKTLILDEPVNGLDPEGVLWVRNLVRHEADRGKTVFLSSHLMSEMALVADDLIVLGRGRLLLEKSVKDFIADSSDEAARVRSPQAVEITAALVRPGITVQSLEPMLLEVHGVPAASIGMMAAQQGWTLYELTPLQVSLEDAYMKLTEHETEFVGHEDGAPSRSPLAASTPREGVRS
ncbi:MAG: ABC transporter ATP-binding protein [Propionibacteriaceae bacterium]|nr:ABC transporter ATP-binding protein [Propionibacteriaceae bacterium]